MGSPTHPLGSQTVRGLGTTWTAARSPTQPGHSDRGTFHTPVTLPAPSGPLREEQRWTGCEGSPASSSWPLASRRSV